MSGVWRSLRLRWRFAVCWVALSVARFARTSSLTKKVWRAALDTMAEAWFCAVTPFNDPFLRVLGMGRVLPCSGRSVGFGSRPFRAFEKGARKTEYFSSGYSL
jgi:hypothetical protein